MIVAAACGSGITMYQHDGLSDADLLTVKEMLERLESLIYKAQEKRRPELSLFEIAWDWETLLAMQNVSFFVGCEKTHFNLWNEDGDEMENSELCRAFRYEILRDRTCLKISEKFQRFCHYFVLQIK